MRVKLRAKILPPIGGATIRLSKAYSSTSPKLNSSKVSGRGRGGWGSRPSGMDRGGECARGIGTGAEGVGRPEALRHGAGSSLG